MSHIAIDARIINSSTGRYIERLLTYLETLDSPHTYSVLVRKKDVDYWRPSNPKFTIVVADYHQYTFGEQLGFYKLLESLRPDLVHFCMPQQPLLYQGRAVTTVHDLNLLHITENEGMSPLTLKFKKWVFRQLLHTVLNRAAHIITPTHYVANELHLFHSLPDERLTVTYESADPVSDHLEAVPAYQHTPFILMVGRAESYKNQRGAIEAHQELLHRHPDLHLVIVGKRDDASYATEHWVQAQGYRQVDFFGFASDDQLAWLYERCAAYVFPTFMEGFGLPGLEAMRHGAPVASSNATCLPEVYGDAALYFDPSDCHGMASQLDKIMTDKKVRAKLIAAGTKQVKKYSWQRMAEQTLAVYDEALRQ